MGEKGRAEIGGILFAKLSGQTGGRRNHRAQRVLVKITGRLSISATCPVGETLSR